MRQIATVYSTMVETFRLQRRDKIFLPAAVVGLALLIFADVASSWGVDNYQELMFNVAATGFHFTGAIVALLWGSKLLADSRSDGSIEVQLAGPVSRVSWLIGKYLGLVASLVLLAVILIGAWQLLYFANELSLIRERDLIIFSLFALEWCLIGAVAFLFASFAGSSVTLFSTFCIWIAGLVSAVIAGIVPDETNVYVKRFVEEFASYWNLQHFNLSKFAVTDEFISSAEILSRYTYGFLLIAICISAAALIFQRRSLIN